MSDWAARPRRASPPAAGYPSIGLVAGRGRRPATASASAATSTRRRRRGDHGDRALAGGRDGDAADILEFQVAMLEDEALVAPARSRIAAGVDAATAWSRRLAAQIADFEATEDDYFRARAADLRDLRDEVHRHLSGRSDRGFNLPDGAVLAGEDVTPSRFLSVDWTRAAASPFLPAARRAMWPCWRVRAACR